MNWDDNADDEASYRVDRWSHIGWRRSIRVGADATAAIISGLSPNAHVTYRISAVTVDGASTPSANIASVSTAADSTTGWYQINLSSGSQGEAGWSLDKDTLKVLPDYRDGSNKRKSKWIYASSWQAAVSASISSWDDYTSQNEPVSIETSEEDGEGNPVFQFHSFPTGGDFKVATGFDLANDPNVNGFDLNDDDTKYIAVEDSYGGIDRDYDDFVWAVDVNFTNEALGGGALSSPPTNDTILNINGVELLEDGSPISGQLKFESSDPAYITYPATISVSESGPVLVEPQYDNNATSVSILVSDVDRPGISWNASATLSYGEATPEIAEKIAADRQRLKGIGKIFVNCHIVTTELVVVQLTTVAKTIVENGVFDPTSYGDYDIFSKTGGMNQANTDFDKIAADNLVQGLIQNLGGGIRTMPLPDGTNVTVYPVSATTGVPTIAIVNQKYGKHRTKIRYP